MKQEGKGEYLSINYLKEPFYNGMENDGSKIIKKFFIYHGLGVFVLCIKTGIITEPTYEAAKAIALTYLFSCFQLIPIVFVIIFVEEVFKKIKSKYYKNDKHT